MILKLLSLPLGVGLLASTIYSFASASGLPPLAGSVGLSQAAALAEQRLSRTPLSADSFYALGIQAQQKGDLARARALIERGLSLNPRSGSIRLWLLTDAVQAGQIAPALTHAEVLTRLKPEAGPVIGALLAQMAREPKVRKEVALRFANDPVIFEIAARGAEQGFEAAQLEELLGPTDLARIPDGISRAQSILVAPLLQEKPREARALWLRVAKTASPDEIFDGEFEGKPGAAPFGWTFLDNANVETTLQPQAAGRDGGILKVVAYGSLAVLAAEQSLALPPGRYELSFTSTSPGTTAADGDFAWVVSCPSSGAIVEGIARSTSSAWREQRHGFVVPGGCSLQTLRLSKLGTPDQRPRTILVSNISIEAS